MNRWIQTSIGTLIGTVFGTIFTERWSDFLFVWLISIIPTRIILYFLFDRKKKREENNTKQHQTKCFNVSEYAKRREKFLLEIEKERQSEPKYEITLWLGFDGLQINEDGTFEWVSRKPEETAYSKTFNDGITNYGWNERDILSLAQNLNKLAYPNIQAFSNAYNQANALQAQNTQSYIDYLHEQNQNMQFQITQQMLNQQVINTVCYPQYLRGENIYPVYSACPINPAWYVNTARISTKAER